MTAPARPYRETNPFAQSSPGYRASNPFATASPPPVAARPVPRTRSIQERIASILVPQPGPVGGPSGVARAVFSDDDLRTDAVTEMESRPGVLRRLQGKPRLSERIEDRLSQPETQLGSGAAAMASTAADWIENAVRAAPGAVAHLGTDVARAPETLYELTQLASRNDGRRGEALARLFPGTHPVNPATGEPVRRLGEGYGPEEIDRAIHDRLQPEGPGAVLGSLAAQALALHAGGRAGRSTAAAEARSARFDRAVDESRALEPTPSLRDVPVETPLEFPSEPVMRSRPPVEEPSPTPHVEPAAERIPYTPEDVQVIKHRVAGMEQEQQQYGGIMDHTRAIEADKAAIARIEKQLQEEAAAPVNPTPAPAAGEGEWWEGMEARPEIETIARLTDAKLRKLAPEALHQELAQTSERLSRIQDELDNLTNLGLPKSKVYQRGFVLKGQRKAYNIRQGKLMAEAERRGVDLDALDERAAISGEETPSQYPVKGFADPGVPFRLNERGALGTEGGKPRNEAAVQEGLFGEKTLVGDEQTSLLGADEGKRTAKLKDSKIQPEETGRLLDEAGRRKALEGETPGDLFSSRLGNERGVLGTGEPEDYRGEHQAPGPKGGAPMHDLTDIFPDDIYGPNGARYYGHGDMSLDAPTVAIIRAAKKNPNAVVTIYRAVPNDITAADRLRLLESQKAHIMRRGKLPPNVETNLNPSQYYNKIWEEVERLREEVAGAAPDKPVTINPGDWVTVNRRYAKEHGESALRGNYRIVSKRVRASELYTDGNSIHEWGYSPKGSEAGRGALPLMGGMAGGIGGGAAAGTTIDDDDSTLEKIAKVGGGVLTGAFLGVHGGRALEDGSAVRAFLKRNMTTAGDMPAGAFDAKIRAGARMAADERTVAYGLRDFRRAARQHYGFKGPDQAQSMLLDDVLKGDRPVTDAPDVLREPLAQMRRDIDAMSWRMVDEGVVDGAMIDRVNDNMGRYATRSYRVYDDPKWAAKVPEPVKIKARNLLRSEYPTAAPEEIDGLLNELLHRGDDSPMTFMSKVGKKDLSTLIRRKDIAPEIRALWGEYRDPMVNYARSMTKMARLVENHQFLGEVKKMGLGVWLHEKPVANTSGSFHHQIAAEGSKVMEPLNGLYTTPEIAEAFTEALTSKAMPDWLRGYMMVNGTVKYAKTVGSIQSQIRNLIGNTGFAIAQGHWRAWKGKNAIRATLANAGLADSKAWRSYYERLTRLGVVQESAYGNELRAALKDAWDTDAFSDLTAHLATRAIKAPLKLAEHGYRAGDDVWKVYAFENELTRYRKAFPKWTPEQLERHVAQIVRNTYPTYSMIPKGIQSLRRFPLIGSFVSFPAEIYRTGFHTLMLTAKELKNPATRPIGAQRLAGMMVAATSVPAAAIGARHLVGMLKQEEEDMRRFVPPWTKNSPILPMGRGPEFSYIDASFTDPYSYLRKPIMALMRGEDWKRSLIDAVGEAMSPFLSEEILAAKVVDIARNTTASGRSVYNESDTPDQRAWDIVAHLWDAVEPGTVTSLERIVKGVHGTVERTGRSYDPKLEAMAMATGVRVSSLDVRQSMQFKARDLVESYGNAHRILNESAASRGTVTPAQLSSSYSRSEQARVDAFKALREDAMAARRMGVSDQDLLGAFEAAGISRRDARGILAGRYRAYMPTDEFLKDAEQTNPAVRERRASIRQMARERSPEKLAAEVTE